MEPTMEVAVEPGAPEPGGVEGNAMIRFTLVTGAWFVGLFGLMRLAWVERVLLTPFAEVQQRVADQLTGAPSDLVYADASCSGGDPLALCVGAIFAFPAAWGSRLRGAAVGFTLITAVNIVRLGHLSLIAENRALLDLLHVYVWPGILILVAAGFVYGWMGRQGFGAADGPPARRSGGTGTGTGAEVASFGGIALGVAARRFLVLAALLVAAYFATAPFFYERPAVDVIAGWIAVTGGAILAAAGTTAAVSGAVIRTAHGGFIVTQECIFTPLIPLYVAAALAAPMGWRRRTAMLAATPAVFFALGVSRLLVLAVPAAVIGSYAVAIHAFSQTLVAVLVVAVAAVRTFGSDRRGAARAAVAVALGAVAAFAAAPVLGAVVGGTAGGLQSLAGHAGHAFTDKQGRGRSCPRSRSGCSRRSGSRWRAAAGRGGAGWPASVAWCWRRRRSASRSTSSPTTTASIPTWACCAAGLGAARGGGLVPHPSGPVHRARHAGPAARAPPGGLTPGVRTGVPSLGTGGAGMMRVTERAMFPTWSRTKVEAAYARSDLFERRRRLMDD